MWVCFEKSLDLTPFQMMDFVVSMTDHTVAGMLKDGQSHYF
ncbi:hypothetical protein [Azospirillum endophyticum]